MKHSNVLLQHLSAFAMLLIYLILVVMHLVSDGFIPGDQAGLILALLPFILVGAILDYCLHKNSVLANEIRIFAQLLPSGVFILLGVYTIFLFEGKDISSLFGYVVWLFIALPFCIASYRKESHRRKLPYAIIGSVSVIVIYLFLSTQTSELNRSLGAVFYLITFFCIIYSASGLKKAPYLGLVLGILNALSLLCLRYIPFTAETKNLGWSYSIFVHIEILTILFLLISILIRFIEAITTKDTVSNS